MWTRRDVGNNPDVPVSSWVAGAMVGGAMKGPRRQSEVHLMLPSSP
jgi:hypothetical protein